MFPGPLGAPECFRAGPMGRDEAPEGCRRGDRGAEAEERLCMGRPRGASRPPRAPPNSWPGRSLQEPQGHHQAPLPPGFPGVSFFGAQAAGAEGHLTGVNI